MRRVVKKLQNNILLRAISKSVNEDSTYTSLQLLVLMILYAESLCIDRNSSHVGL